MSTQKWLMKLLEQQKEAIKIRDREKLAIGRKLLALVKRHNETAGDLSEYANPLEQASDKPSAG